MHAQDSPITEWQVLVHPMPDETMRGVLRFVEGKPTLKLESGEVIDSETEGVTFSVEHEIVVGEKGESVFRELKDRVRIVLKPRVVRHLPYTPHLAVVEEDMYPPSTNGWYGRYIMAPADTTYSYEESTFIYIVQEIKEEKQFWLTIYDIKSSVIFESHLIQKYEEPVLRMTGDREYRRQRVKSLRNTSKLKEQVLEILDEPPPTWEQLTFLARGVSIQDLKVKKTMGSTLDLLVPKSVPSEQRDQIKAFLALTLSINDIPHEDPVEYLEKYYGTRLLRNLLSIHLRILAQSSKIPDYVALMFAAEKGTLEKGQIYEGPKIDVIRRLERTILKPPYYKHHWKEIIGYLDSLNQSGMISTGLPITKNESMKSKAAWLSRIELMMAGTRISVQIRYPTIGLVKLVYFGSAHTWFHKNLVWFAKTTDISEVKFPRTRFFQVMVMPPAAAQQAKRAMTNISEIEWSLRRVNHNLYNATSGEWNIRIPKIIDSIEDTCSFKKLMKTFKIQRKKIIHNISKRDAKIIDEVKSGLYLDTLDSYFSKNIISFTKKELFETLESFQSKGIVDVSYEATQALAEVNKTYVTIAEGNSDTICSIAKAFLVNTPSSFLYVEKGARRIYLLSRLTKASAHKLIRNIPRAGELNDVQIRFSEVSEYGTYESDLLQRLLNDDGSWNSDITELISQVRVMQEK